MYEYNAEVLSVTDGDTVDFRVDLGFHPVWLRLERGRLYGIDAPEKNTEPGKEAKAWLQSRLPVGTKVRIKTIKMKRILEEQKEKYGGFLVTILLKPDDPNEISLNDQMIQAGHAKPYFGGKR